MNWLGVAEEAGRAHLLVDGRVLNHVLVGIGLGIDPCLGALDGEREGVHDDDGVALALALHEAHDLDVAAGAGVDDHLEQRERGDLGAAEVVRVVGPGLLLLRPRLHRVVVAVDRVHRVRVRGRRRDVVLQLPRLPRDRRRRGGLHRAAVRAVRRRGGQNPRDSERRRKRRGRGRGGVWKLWDLWFVRLCGAPDRYVEEGCVCGLYGPRRRRVVLWFAEGPERME